MKKGTITLKQLRKLHNAVIHTPAPTKLYKVGGTKREMYPIKFKESVSIKKFKGFDVLPDPDAFPFEMKSEERIDPIIKKCCDDMVCIGCGLKQNICKKKCKWNDLKDIVDDRAVPTPIANYDLLYGKEDDARRENVFVGNKHKEFFNGIKFVEDLNEENKKSYSKKQAEKDLELIKHGITPLFIQKDAMEEILGKYCPKCDEYIQEESHDKECLENIKNNNLARKDTRYFHNTIYTSKDYFIHGFCAGLAFLFFIILIFVAK